MKPKHVCLIALTIVFVLLSPQSDTQAYDGVVEWPPGYADMVIDEVRGLIYASGGRLAGTSTRYYVDVISMDTLQILQQIPVGVEPAGVDLSPDGNHIAVALYGEGKIRILNADTYATVTDIVPYVTSANRPWDVAFGAGGRMYSTGSPYCASDSGDDDFLHAYDTSTWQEINRVSGEYRCMPNIYVTPDLNTLYVTQNRAGYTVGWTHKFDISSGELIYNTNSDGFRPDHRAVCKVDDHMYSNHGDIFSLGLSMEGTLPVSGDWFGCAEEQQQVCFVDDKFLSCYDTANDEVAFKIVNNELDIALGLPKYSTSTDMWFISTNRGIRKVAPDQATNFFIYHDLVVDEPRNTLYGSCTECNSIHIMDLQTLDIIDEYPVVAAPLAMDISPDGDTLAYLMKDDAGLGAIGLIDLVSDTVGSQYIVNTSNNPFADVIYGDNELLYMVGDGYTENPDYLHAYDLTTSTEIWRSSLVYNNQPELVLSGNRAHLYISQRNNIYHYDISAGTPVFSSHHSILSDETTRVCVHDGNVYASGGEILPDNLAMISGQYGDPDGEKIICSDNSEWLFVVEKSHNLQTRQFPQVETEIINRTVDTSEVFGIAVRPQDEALIISTDAGLRVYRTETIQTGQFGPILHKHYCKPRYWDYFEVPETYWPVGEDNDVLTEVTGGYYRVLAKNPAYYYFFRAPTCERENIYIEAHARWGIQRGASYGILFELRSDWSDFYLFEVYEEYKAFRLLHRGVDGWSQIGDVGFTDAIKLRDTGNILAVKRYGTTYQLIVNGEIVRLGVHAGTGDAFFGTGIAVVPWTDGGIAEGRFTEFGVRALDVGGNFINGSDEIQLINSTNTTTLIPPDDFDWPLPPFDLMIQQAP